DGTSAIRLRRKRTCRSANPRAAQRILLLVFDHRLERQSGAIATRDWQSDVATTIWWECLREKANGAGDGVKSKRAGAAGGRGAASGGAVLRPADRLEPYRRRAKPDHHRGGGGGALPHLAYDRRQ